MAQHVTIKVYLPVDHKYQTETFNEPLDYNESADRMRLTVTMPGSIRVFVGMPYQIVKLTT